MIYKACAELGMWPLSRVVKVDDAEVGIAEVKAAGAFTVGIASGNLLGLALEDFLALPSVEQTDRLERAREILTNAGADLVIDTIATLVPELEGAVLRRP